MSLDNPVVAIIDTFSGMHRNGERIPGSVKCDMCGDNGWLVAFHWKDPHMEHVMSTAEGIYNSQHLCEFHTRRFVKLDEQGIDIVPLLKDITPIVREVDLRSSEEWTFE